jgi:DnaJ-class molecular chaperone
LYNPVIEKQAKILGVTYPFTSSELKNAFTQLAFKYHPDKGGTPEQFITIKDAYEFLKAFTADTNINTKATSEGDLLSNLGKGLGDLVNQKPCSRCHGKGWEYKQHFDYTYDHICRNCNGTGFVGRRYNICFVCLGTGGIGKHEQRITQMHTCYECKGTGYLQVLNPVLPKNKIFTKVPNKRIPIKKQYCDNCGARVSGRKCWSCGKEYIIS